MTANLKGGCLASTSAQKITKWATKLHQTDAVHVQPVTKSIQRTTPNKQT